MNEEKIVCAAIKHPSDGDGDIIIGGCRHSDCFETAKRIGRGVYIDEDKQGFITNKGRFVGRKEALIIAKQAGQLIRSTNSENLYSDDIY